MSDQISPVAKLTTLDEFLLPHLVRPFYLVGSAFALLLAGIGLLVGLAALATSPVIGLMTMVLTLTAAAALFLGVRLAAETMLAVHRVHQRFVGGHPRDPVPE